MNAKQITSSVKMQTSRRQDIAGIEQSVVLHRKKHGRKPYKDLVSWAFEPKIVSYFFAKIIGNAYQKWR